MQMALASLMGQAFHLLSPLVAFIYLLLRLTGLDMGEWQKESAKYAAVIFVIFVVTIVLRVTCHYTYHNNQTIEFVEKDLFRLSLTSLFLCILPSYRLYYF